MLGPEGHRHPPNLVQAPTFFSGCNWFYILISLSRCCHPNDEGPALPLPKYFFLEPPLVSLAYVCIHHLAENDLLED